jgi:hypothetical protein
MFVPCFPNRLIRSACLWATLLLLLFPIDSSASEPAFSIVNASIQQSDNGAVAPSDYEFLPGDPLYVVFEISGFGVKADEEKDTKSISLTWAIRVTDQDDVLLAPAQEGEIKTGLSAEDKKWLPKRRAEFALPQLLSAGKYRVHITAKDLLSNTETAKDLTFAIGGHKVEPSRSIGPQQLRFSREEGGPALEVAAFRPGDTIFTSFDITGFAQTAEHQYRVTYRFDVFGPDRKAFVKQPQAVELSAAPFYPAKFLPVNFSILAPSESPRGEYTLVLTITDEISKQSSETKSTLTLE